MAATRLAEGEVPRVDVLGVPVAALDLRRAVRVLERWLAESASPRYVTVTGVHGVMESQRDPEVMRCHRQAALCVPDGMPLVWLGWLQGHRRMGRVYGPDLMLALCRRSRRHGWRHFFYGGRPGVAERLRERLCARFPGLSVVGTFTPPFRSLTAAEERELCARVAATRPHIFWVGLSTPKQERFMAAYCGRLGVPLMIGVGAAFDMHAGLLRQAPRFCQRLGLEWLFRLCMEPRRLWRRYLRNNPAFVWRVARDLVLPGRNP